MYNNPNQPAARPWSTGICHSCFSDCSLCESEFVRCVTCWCPCITFGRIAEIVDEGATFHLFRLNVAMAMAVDIPELIKSHPCAVSAAIYALIMHFTGCGCCCYSFIYRSKMRRRYMLLEEPCADCLVHCCCHKCALRQEYRELQHQGFDMSL
ncbi:hypothetical protein RJ640_029217, partial [Escallonia rubra]